MTTRIVCISDTHCQLKKVDIPDGDILIHAGDLTYRGSREELVTELAELGMLPHKYKIIIAGNHDWLFQKEREEAEELAEANGLIYLQDSDVNIEGIKIWGSPWQPEFCNWAFNLSRYDYSLKEKWDLIPDDTNLLITHGPPMGTLDLTDGTYHAPERVGCVDLADRVKQLKKLRYHIFGHIHGQYGVQPGPVTYVNASVCNERYEPTNSPVILVEDL